MYSALLVGLLVAVLSGFDTGAIDIARGADGRMGGVCITLLAGALILDRFSRLSGALRLVGLVIALVGVGRQIGEGGAGWVVPTSEGDAASQSLYSALAVFLISVGALRVRLGRFQLSQMAMAASALMALIAVFGRLIDLALPALSSHSTLMPLLTALAVVLLIVAQLARYPEDSICQMISAGGRSSLTLKLAVPVVGVIIVAIGGVHWVAMSSIRKSHDDQIVNEAHLAMSSLRGVFVASSNDGDAQRGLEEMLRAGRVTDAVVVNARTHRVVASSHREWIGQLLFSLPWEGYAEEIWAAIETGRESLDMGHLGGQVVDLTAFVTRSRPRADAGSEAARSDGMVAMLHIRADDIRFRMTSQMRQLGVVIAGVFLVTCVFAAYLVRIRLLKRISHIADVIQRWSQGEVELRTTRVADDELGRIAGSLNNMLDMVEAQRQQISLLATVSRRTTNAVLLLDIDQRIVWANEAFTRMSGYESWDCLTKKLDTIAFCERTDSDTVARIREAIANREGIRTEILLHGMEGHEYWVDLDIQPMRNDNGEFNGFIVIQTDIDARKTTELELDRVRGHLYTAIETIDAAVVMYDRDGRFVMCNSTYRETGFVRSDLLVRGTPIERIVTAFFEKYPAMMRDRPLDQCVADELTRYRSGAATWTVFLGDQYLRLSTRPTPDGGIVCVGIDVTEIELIHTELNAAFEAAESANRTKTEFLANMSHEIRTPMSAILGYAEMLNDDENVWGDPEKRRDYLKVIERSGEHLMSIINDILDLSKIEAGKMTIEDIPFDPMSLVRNVAELYDVNARLKELKLGVIAESPAPKRILGDPVRVQQVICNLVGNAIKFTKDGGVRIIVRVDDHAERSRLVISVNDTGIGMTSEQMSRLFNAFEQAETSTSRRFGGTGLGLRISKRLMELMGGTLSVASTLGQGSDFTLSLPLRIADADGGDAVSTSTAAGADESDNVCKLADRRVLLMEDGVDNQKLIRHLLESAGAEVKVTDNGRDGICAMTVDGTLDGALRSPAPFDLILTDVQMPEMDGYAASELLRDMGCSTPIVVLTADAMAGTAERCLAAGCDSFVSKPVSRATLIEVCVRAIEANAAMKRSLSDQAR